MSVTKSFIYLSPWDPLCSRAIIPPCQVVTAFLQKKNKFLVLQRARKDQQHLLWGIPGGKLEQGETPLLGLIRELNEELGAQLPQNTFRLLKTTMSRTSCDGQYGLYLYHAFVPENLIVNINLEEHYSYRWVSLEEFETLNLLTAQGEAYRLVEDELKNILRTKTIKKS